MAANRYDMEELLRQKTFEQLTTEEQEFVLTQVGDAEEYERIRRMLPLMSESPEPELAAPAGFRDALLQEASQHQEEQKVIPMVWYRRRWVLWTATSVAASLLFAMVWFFTGNNADVISTDPIVKVEERAEETPQTVPDKASPEVAEPGQEIAETNQDEPIMLIEEEVAERPIEPEEDLTLAKGDAALTLDAYDFTPQPGMTQTYTWNGSAGATTSANVIVTDTVISQYFLDVDDDLTGTVARTGNALNVPTVKSTEKGSVSSQVATSNTRIVQESTSAEVESLDEVAVLSSKGRKIGRTSKTKRASSKMGETRIPSTSQKLSGQRNLLPLLTTTRDN